MPDTRTEPQTALREAVWSAQHDATCDDGGPHLWTDHLPWDEADEAAATREADAIIAAVRAALRDTPESPVAALPPGHPDTWPGGTLHMRAAAPTTPREADTNVGDGWAPDEYGGVLPSGGPE